MTVAVAQRGNTILVRLDGDGAGQAAVVGPDGSYGEPMYEPSIVAWGYWRDIADPELAARAEEVCRANLTAAAWEETKHPRHPRGSERGGEFAPKFETAVFRGPDAAAAAKGLDKEVQTWPIGEPRRFAREALVSVPMKPALGEYLYTVRKNGDLIAVGASSWHDPEYIYAHYAGAIRGGGLPMFRMMLADAAAHDQGLYFVAGTDMARELYDRMGFRKVPGGYLIPPDDAKELAGDVFAYVRERRYDPHGDDGPIGPEALAAAAWGGVEWPDEWWIPGPPEELTAAAWDPTKHPRHPAGSDRGGEFAPTGQASVAEKVKDGTEGNVELYRDDPYVEADPGVAVEYEALVDTQKQIRATLPKLDELHDLPPEADEVFLWMDKSMPPGKLGEHHRQLVIGDAPVPYLQATQIRINPFQDSENVPGVVTHEFGHYLDVVLDGVNDPDGVPHRPWSSSPAALEWRSAVHNTEAVATLKRARRTDPQYFDYLTSDEELWARSYAQWAATRLGDDELLASVRRPGDRAGLTERQWSDVDFAPVAAAIDKVMDRADLRDRRARGS